MTVTAGYEILRDAPPIQPRQERPIRFQLISFDDLKVSSETDYLVKGVFPRRGLALVWGPPKCGKSFWVFTVAMHIALGREYRGCRVHKNEVVYLALEGFDGFRNRAEAFRRRFLEPDEKAPGMRLSGASLDLVKDRLRLVADIKRQSAKPACVVIDTMNRSFAGSESKDEDMSAYLRAADAVQAAFGCLVIIVHHCGIDDTRPRGHTAQTGAADVQVSVRKDASGVVTATVDLAKDMPDGAIFTSRLERVELGIDQDGDSISSCVVVPCDEAAVAAGKSFSAQTIIALRALTEALDETGAIQPASNHIPPQTPVVTLAQWAEYAQRCGITSHTGIGAKSPADAERLRREAVRKALSRASEALIAARKVGAWGEFRWLIRA